MQFSCVDVSERKLLIWPFGGTIVAPMYIIFAAQYFPTLTFCIATLSFYILPIVFHWTFILFPLSIFPSHYATSSQPSQSILVNLIKVTFCNVTCPIVPRHYHLVAPTTTAHTLPHSSPSSNYPHSNYPPIPYPSSSYHFQHPTLQGSFKMHLIPATLHPLMTQPTFPCPQSLSTEDIRYLPCFYYESPSLNKKKPQWGKTEYNPMCRKACFYFVIADTGQWYVGIWRGW